MQREGSLLMTTRIAFFCALVFDLRYFNFIGTRNFVAFCDTDVLLPLRCRLAKRFLKI